MGSIFTSMVSTAGAMRALQTSLTVVQNNIVNASTVGYARQEVSLVANPFNPTSGSTSGGVSPGPPASTRNPFVESAVWKTQNRAGYSGGLATKMTELERVFPLADGTGISGEMDRFFGSVSQWSMSPNDPVARRQILDRAGALAQTFNQTAADLGDSSARAAAELTNTVRHVNRLTGDIMTINKQRRESLDAANDAGLDATIHAKLEELSQYVNFTALPQEDGSVSVFLAGQTPAVIGDRQWPISLTNSNGQFQVLDDEGVDITGRLKQGKLGAILEYRNEMLPAYKDRLNTLASGFADQVNGVLNGGIDVNGDVPVRNLFTYDATIGAAATMGLTGITSAELAAAAVGDPGGNTNALDLADLQNNAMFGGLTPSQFLAELTGDIGNRLNAERSNASLQGQLLMQAQSVREEVSGVDINMEATKLLQLQKGFQAAGQVMSVLNTLTETLINLIR